MESEDNPLYGGNKIDTLWEKDYGLKMSSSVNELWLYDSMTKGGRDDDLETINSHNYKAPEQGNVLIIQEHEEGIKKRVKKT